MECIITLQTTRLWTFSSTDTTATPFCDFCGGNKVSREAGRNSRSRAESPWPKSGRNHNFWNKERRDCLSWVEYAIGRFGKDVKITLAGVSMGAATVLMAISLGLPENVKAIIADCGYSSPKAIIRKVARDQGFVPWLVYPLSGWEAAYSEASILQKPAR
ncbi:MAG: hypothetical protein ACLTK0_00965 [Anaerovoracaceae bacterium]